MKYEVDNFPSQMQIVPKTKSGVVVEVKKNDDGIIYNLNHETRLRPHAQGTEGRHTQGHWRLLIIQF